MSQQKTLFDRALKPEEKALSVMQLTQSIKTNLESRYNQVWLKAEISNFKAHSSGHFYFSLKDEKAQINAVMFKGHNLKLRFRPKDGLEVLARGNISVYPPRGSYQILCDHMQPLGQGGLKEEFERLKNKLKAEGLFDPQHKKALPLLPFKIAVVTSPTGAAVRDMIHVLKRRHPAAEVVVVPCLTQGAAAPESIIKALSQAEKIPGVEVIIASRGGGSLEDLWCFNDEELARKIFAMQIPVVSGVGHEIDFTICDFVSDLRAPTPSAAAEMVCQHVKTLRERLGHSGLRLQKNMTHRLRALKEKTFYLEKRLVNPQRRLADYRLRADDLLLRTEKSVTRFLAEKKREQINFQKSLFALPKKITPYKKQLVQQQERLKFLIKNSLMSAQEKEGALNLRLKALSPYAVLERGYSIVHKQDQSVVRSSEEVKKKDQLKIQTSKGTFKAEVL